jgi:hypothetical protein
VNVRRPLLARYSAANIGLREQVESSRYPSLSFDREVDVRDSRRLALRLKAAKLRDESTVGEWFPAPRGFAVCRGHTAP